DHGLEIEVLAVKLSDDLSQILGLEHLELVAHRRYDAGKTAADAFDETAAAVRGSALNDAAPFSAIVAQLAIPFIVVVSFVALFQPMFDRLGFGCERVEDLFGRRQRLIVRRSPIAERLGYADDVSLPLGVGLRLLSAAFALAGVGFVLFGILL